MYSIVLSKLIQEKIARNFLEADIYHDPKTTLENVLAASIITDS